ncbi:probable G-protein coupled receptor 132 isoform X1 [Cricetulus griseus]|uniref:Probable G-protein coupled receptor 132 isoform X1 n=1 Tax=Cricetulus griseus TaxID=10029 RepID=A0A9J7JRI9_CRIGR|nr:probable G-protein coupled receptor 132 isoform X1 [Cricetulus griseus]XP_027276814.1 probable G-protein coupled receptor 132 isoform X1 [Cricetulus griseus]
MDQQSLQGVLVLVLANKQDLVEKRPSAHKLAVLLSCQSHPHKGHKAHIGSTMRSESIGAAGNSTPGVPSILLTVSVPSSKVCRPSYEESRVVLVVVYSAVCMLGLPANCLTAWLTLLQVLQRNVLAVYLFFLSVCELLYIGTLPLWIIYIENEHRWSLGPQACKVTAYVFFCNIYISILLLCCISCDRYMAVVYALESRGHRHQKTAIIVSVIVFVLVGLVNYPVFDIKMERNSCFEPLDMNSKIASYHYLRFAFGFAIPLGTLAFTNHRIFRSIKLSSSLSTSQKAKVKHSAVAVVTIFLVCFAPYHLVLLIKAVSFSIIGGDEDAVCAFESRLYTVSVVFLCLSTVNSVADPIIYVLATDHSRQEVSRIHTGWKKWSTKTYLTDFKNSEETHLPTALTNSYTFPKPVHPPGSQLAELDQLDLRCSPERLPEEFC